MQEINNEGPLERKAKVAAQMGIVLAEIDSLRVDFLETLPRDIFIQKRRRMADLQKQFGELNAQKQAVKVECAKAHQVREWNHQKWKREMTSRIIPKLREVRDKWQAFSTDQTRVSSMRLMASQFVADLSPIMRELFKEKEDSDRTEGE